MPGLAAHRQNISKIPQFFGEIPHIEPELLKECGFRWLPGGFYHQDFPRNV
jgi:hypothetical protein